MDHNSVISFCMLELTFSFSKVLKVISSCKNRRCDYLYATEFCSLFLSIYNEDRLNINHQKNIFKIWIGKFELENWSGNSAFYV